MSFQREFEVANPSIYPRSDYVEVDMETLGVPASLDEKTLKLSRITKKPEAYPGEGPLSSFEIPFQIDQVLGANSPKRVLTFLSSATPPGAENYTGPTATFLLEEGTPKDFSSERERGPLWIGYYHERPKLGEPKDGFNRERDPERKVYGVKPCSDVLEVYFSLVPHPGGWTATSLAGAVTSAVHRRARDWSSGWGLDHAADPAARRGEMLSPFQDPAPDYVHWGQLTYLAFYPLPWERHWFHKKSLLRAEELHKESVLRAEEREREYELVWSHCGLIRSVVTLKSEPLTIRYEGKPYFEPDYKDVTCHLYRVISIYPGRGYYVEQLYVRTESDLILAFTPYFTSYINMGVGVPAEISRFEHVPDYFAVWRHFSPMHYGYGFASDAHVRDVMLSSNGDEISWRLQLGHDRKCLHYFMLNSYSSPPLDPLKEIGHFGWYENILKPLRVLPILPDLLPDLWDVPFE